MNVGRRHDVRHLLLRSKRHEAYAAASITGGAIAAALGDVVDALVDSLEELDTALRSHPALLQIAAGTSLLDNWRALLAPAYRDCPPWWLSPEAVVA